MSNIPFEQLPTANLVIDSTYQGARNKKMDLSRIKHRDFGVLVTTSAVSPQTYEEVREDRHPIVIVSGRDIAEVLITEGIKTIDKLDQWISKLDFERLSGVRK